MFGIGLLIAADEYFDLAQSASQVFMACVRITVDNGYPNTLSPGNAVGRTDIQDTQTVLQVCVGIVVADCRTGPGFKFLQWLY